MSNISDEELSYPNKPAPPNTIALVDGEAGNPWKETVHGPEALQVKPSYVHNSELREEIPSTAAQSSSAETDSRPSASEDVLREFDPLADTKEAESRMAWETSEGHPMPPPKGKGLCDIEGHDHVPHSAPPTEHPLPSKSGSSSAIGFPSLVSLAKSLTLSRVRPRSLDTAPAEVTDTITAVMSSSKHRPTQSVAATSGSWAEETPGDGGPAGTFERQDSDEPPPFDFQKFLDQMKTKSAEPVAKYLRSFLSNFAKRSFPVSEQIKVVNEFLNFIAAKMREADVWKIGSEAEFDNAMEGMEKLVMNRLYEFTFTPQLAEAIPPRPITTDDLERDRVLAQRIALFGWIEERHLDVPEGSDSRGFLKFAQQELLKINHYKAPRDKLICILNCCKVIFGLIRHLRREENADSFIPILIYVVLKANPPNLISNIEYIQRFRNPQKLQSESGYYFSSLMGAVQFIESMDHTGLSNITAEEFERNVEDAIHDLPASPSPAAESSVPATPSSRPSTPFSFTGPSTPARPTTRISLDTHIASAHAGEESAEPLAISLGGVGSAFAEDTRRFLQRTGDALGKPLNALGRLLNDALDGFDGVSGSPPGTSGRAGAYFPGPFAPMEIARARETSQTLAYGPGGGAGEPPPPIATPYKPRVRPFPPAGGPYLSPGTPGSPASGMSGRSTPDSLSALGTPSRSAPGTYPVRGGELGSNVASPIPRHLVAVEAGLGVSRTPTPALDIVGLQAEIDEAHARQADAALGTLTQIFPGVDREVIEWVLEAENGDLGRSIEKLLEVGGSGGGGS